MRKTLIVMTMAMALTLSMVGMAMADGWPSTNEDNKQAGVPHVNLVEATSGTVTLEFVNDTNSLAFFEYRIDGEALSEGTEHPNPCVIGEDVEGSPCFGRAYMDADEVIYPGVTADGRDEDEPVVVEETFDASEKVEIRLALGGERDWDFDWTTFEVEAAPTKDDCKNGGFDDLGFRNQGQCIASIQANENAAPHN